MIKRISTVALATLICLPTLATAGAGSSTDRVADLEKQMAEMNKAFTAQMQAMQNEIAALKTKNAEMSKDVANTSETIKKSAEAADWTKQVSLGGEITLHGYNLQNVWDFDDTQDSDNGDFFRTKGSLWADFSPTTDVTAHIKLTAQTWGEGVSNTTVLVPGGGSTTIDSALDNNSNKIFLDNAYINVKNLLNLPLTGTFGRQNLIYGSGFVLMDGQSQFSSASIYFDGIKLRWDITDQVMLDTMYMKSRENTMFNDANGNSGDDQNLAGFYLTNKKCALTGMQQELYALNRTDEAIKKDIWMYGLRLSDKLANGIDYSLEGAIQRGDANASQDQDAWGTKLEGGYTFLSQAWKPRVYLGYALMSGDDSSTTQDSEQWDVFYGGWPQWGDLLAWKYLNLPVPDTANSLNGVYDSYNANSTVPGEAVYSNLQIATLGASINPTDKLTFGFSYSRLTFDETAAGIDDDFGDYYQATAKYQYNKYLSFSLYGALLEPGSAFTSQDKATETYWQTQFRF
ncbi:MAG: alginate export family protein [Proteobacteria bacterium]|nr:alginate export family protein [Pseudomonadota bacterium]